jgi:hypothetical protein
MKYLFLIICLVLCLSCKHVLDGDCYPILPEEELSIFNSQGGIDSTYIGYNWWFSDKYNKGCKFIEPQKIECSWFSAEKKGNYTVVVSVKQNDTSQKREGYARIESKGGTGECSENSGWVSIAQCSDLTDIELSKEEFLFSAEGGIDSVIIATNRESWLNQPYIGIWYENAVYGYDFYEEYIKWFNINIIDEKKIIFSVNRNETGEERNFSIAIDDSECGPRVKVIQSAE